MEQDFIGKTEGQVWQEFRDGSRAAYTHIYVTYAPVLYNYGYKIVPDRTLVEDCIQDLFEHLLRNRSNLSPTDSIKFYLFKAMRRQIIGKVNGSHRIPFASNMDPETGFQVEFSFEAGLVAEELIRERQESLVKALNELPARQKEAVYLRFYDNLTYEQVAAIMGIDTHSVYKTIYKAINSLQKNLAYPYSIGLVVVGLL